MTFATRIQSQIAHTGLMLLVLGSTVWAASPRKLSSQVWQEQTYGISLHPPQGTDLVQKTADDYLLRIVDKNRAFRISLSVKRSRSKFPLKQVLEDAKKQIKRVQPSSALMGRVENVRVGGFPASVLYFHIPASVGGTNLFGQGVVQMLTPHESEQLKARRINAESIESDAYLVLELEAAASDESWVKPTFQSVLNTLQIRSQRDLAYARLLELKHTEAWRRAISTSGFRYAKSLRPEQYLRLLDSADRDIGYLRVRQKAVAAVTDLNLPEGIEVEVKLHVTREPSPPDNPFLATVNTTATYYVAENGAGDSELWSVRTTQRVYPNGRSQPARTNAIAETGVRKAKNVEINVTGSAHKEYRFETPPGYLSQAEGWLLPQLLIHSPHQGKHGFYWYNSTESRMTYRTDMFELVPGGYVIKTRLSPNSSELVSRYDDRNRLLEKQLPGGQRLVAATQAEILAKWRNR